MNGSIIISLDFELMWGVRDHRTAQDYGDSILGGRDAIPHILARFDEAGIRATWATVGLLFAENRQEMLEFAPKYRPMYRNSNLSPYDAIESGSIGDDEASDPLHFGASLIEKIAETPGQEIATHTYSHFYCMEPGADGAAFDAYLDAAVTIAKNKGFRIQSIVFPRNQTTSQFIELSKKRGLANTEAVPMVGYTDPDPVRRPPSCSGWHALLMAPFRLDDSKLYRPVVMRKFGMFRRRDF